MYFESPIWLYLLPLIIGGIGMLLFASSKANTRLATRFASAKIIQQLLQSVSQKRTRIKQAYLLIGTALVIMALARPQWGHDWEKIPSRGIDILIAIDTSRSMLAEDIQPNRIMRSKLAILDLLEKLQSDRIGLIAFSGSAFLQCPLTLDYDAFRMTLDSIEAGIIPQRGTNIAAAIGEAEAAFDQKSNQKLLILITDGEDHEGSGLERAKEAKEEGLLIYTIGVGTLEGSIIPDTGSGNRNRYLRNQQGEVVKTRLESKTLVKIAEATGAYYTPLGTRGEGLQNVYNEALSKIPKSEREESLKQIGIERFQWPLGIACLCLALESIIHNRRKTPSPQEDATQK